MNTGKFTNTTQSSPKFPAKFSGKTDTEPDHYSKLYSKTSFDSAVICWENWHRTWPLF